MLPAEIVKRKGKEFFVPSQTPDPEPSLEIIWSLDDWEARCFELLSPIGVAHAHGIKRCDLEPLQSSWAVLGVPRSSIVSLVAAAAERAFWDFRLPLLKKICGELGMSLAEGTDEFDTVFAMTKGILKLVDEDCLARCHGRLDLRRGGGTVMQEVLHMDEADQVLDDFDRREVVFAMPR
jgi:hypothetical protein